LSLRIGIGGIGGRMGREIAAAALADPAIALIGGVTRPGSVAAVQSSFGPDIRIAESVAELLPAIDVLVDFTSPAVTVGHARACASARRPMVSGVTGLTAGQIDELRDAARAIPLFYARNMSLGISAILAVLPVLVRALDGYDVEIVESHHRHKADAPSGTAVALAEAIASALDADLGERAVYGRQGVAPRRAGDIGIHAIRAGGNAGEHTVLLADAGEEIRIAHRALSRRTFALGALRAASFVVAQPPGLYTMANLVSAGVSPPQVPPSGPDGPS
jgi:4-hydroxy-tetrahydrodipicolinate reductase